MVVSSASASGRAISAPKTTGRLRIPDENEDGAEHGAPLVQGAEGDRHDMAQGSARHPVTQRKETSRAKWRPVWPERKKTMPFRM